MHPQTNPMFQPTQWKTATTVNSGWMRQFHYFLSLFPKVKNIPGDVVECGVGEGNTLCMLAYCAANENQKAPRLVWGFDSFEGWPEPTAHDHSARNPQKGEWRVDRQEVKERLVQSNLLKEYPNLRVEIIPGFFNETLPAFAERPIAFLHIDADLYPGYRDVLTYLFPKVSPGGIVLFDEYKEFPSHPEYCGGEKWPGCTKAVDDYFASLPYVIQRYDGTKSPKYYMVKE